MLLVSPDEQRHKSRDAASCRSRDYARARFAYAVCLPNQALGESPRVRVRNFAALSGETMNIITKCQEARTHELWGRSVKFRIRELVSNERRAIRLAPLHLLGARGGVLVDQQASQLPQPLKPPRALGADHANARQPIEDKSSIRLLTTGADLGELQSERGS